jgi:hypothetical protein
MLALIEDAYFRKSSNFLMCDFVFFFALAWGQKQGHEQS